MPVTSRIISRVGDVPLVWYRTQSVDIGCRNRPDQLLEIEFLITEFVSERPLGNGSFLTTYRTRIPAIVFREGRDVIYEQVTRIDSLDLHRNRDALREGISSGLQAKLEQKDPDVFTITRVAIRALNTDPTIEAAIQKAVQAQKTLEAKKVEVEIAGKDAEIEIARARGIAEANAIINSSLTPEYLQHELNEALKMFAENDGGVVVIPANMQGMSMILDGNTLNRAEQRR